jgi:hypothetical protein
MEQQLEVKNRGSKSADVNGKEPSESPDDTEFWAEAEKDCEEEDEAETSKGKRKA